MWHAGRIFRGFQGKGADRAGDAAGDGTPDAKWAGGENVQWPSEDDRAPADRPRKRG